MSWEFETNKTKQNAHIAVEEIMAENSPNLANNINLQIQEAQQTPSSINF